MIEVVAIIVDVVDDDDGVGVAATPIVVIAVGDSAMMNRSEPFPKTNKELKNTRYRGKVNADDLRWKNKTFFLAVQLTVSMTELIQ